ncbi:MAG: preprotein translocase subunit YajC [Clostridia bacterium]|nr:preprotein translocase subunit YajC [Clostridia bacterium]
MKLTLKLLTTLFSAILFAVPAFAEGSTTPTAGAADPSGMIIMLVLLGVVFYFFMYRPQKKQEKEIKEMRDSLTVGDEVVTNAGILGRIVRIKDDIVTLELGSDRNKMKVYNWAIREVVLPANAGEDDEPKKVEAEK